MSRWGIAAGVTSVVAMVLLFVQSLVQAADVVVYRSPSCGCCAKWVQHLQQSGLDVEAGGYLVEGHAPGDLIHRQVRESPSEKALQFQFCPWDLPAWKGHVKTTTQWLFFAKMAALRSMTGGNSALASEQDSNPL